MTAESGHKKAKAIPLHKSLAVNHSQMCHHLFRRRVASIRSWAQKALGHHLLSDPLATLENTNDGVL